MSKNPSQQDHGTMPICSVTKKLKRLRFLFEPSLGVLGVFFVIMFVICCFFYLDFRSVGKGYGVTGQSARFTWRKLNGSDGNNQKIVEFLEENGNGCDVFDGDWIWDENYPLYKSKDCNFLDQGFRCNENGRPDSFYTKWRWQPRNCNLPRFNAKLMLEKLRNKRVVFVGDSIGRNQWESLLCMLSSAVVDKNSIYEINGNPITKHKGFLVFKFKDYNSTMEYYRAPFLVLQSRPPRGARKKIKTTLKLDQMDWNSVKWKGADVLVFNTGHWWNYHKTIKVGCYFQEGEKVKTKMNVEEAYRRSINTVTKWIQNEVNTSKTQVFFRTFSPVHFRGGDWRTGGNCHTETLPELGTSLVPLDNRVQFKIATDALQTTTSNTSKTLDLLNVTRMSGQRKDGHASIYYIDSKTGPIPYHRQDCSHWCLPGVPDAWNELLYALFLKRQATRSSNESMYSDSSEMGDKDYYSMQGDS